MIKFSGIKLRAIHGSLNRMSNVQTTLYTSIPLLVLQSFLHTQQMQEFPNALHVPRYNNENEMTSKYSVNLEKRSLVLGDSIFTWNLHFYSSMKIISQHFCHNWISRFKICKGDLSKSPSVIIKPAEIYTEQQFSVTLIVIPFKAVLPFESLNEILQCDR